jgi:hypothetical protein
MATPAASPIATPVSRRPISSPGRACHAASSPAATIIVATPPSIMTTRKANATAQKPKAGLCLAMEPRLAPGKVNGHHRILVI